MYNIHWIQKFFYITQVIDIVKLIFKYKTVYSLTKTNFLYVTNNTKTGNHIRIKSSRNKRGRQALLTVLQINLIDLANK